MPAQPPPGGPPPGAGQQWRLSGNPINATNFLGTTNRQPLSIRTVGAERVRVNTSGKVGVGTSSPETAVHVAGDRVRLETGGRRVDLRADGAHVDLQSTTSKLYLHSSGPNGSNQVIINPQRNEGNVGIGTTNPLTRLHVLGNRVRLESSPKHIDIRADGNHVDVQSSSHKLYLHSSGPGGNNQVIINPFGNEGNVGIGTEVPQRKLHVAGEIMADDVVLSSDATLKTDVTPVTEAGRRIELIRGVAFTRTGEPAAGKRVARRSVGVIAQEVEEAFPELVSTGDDANGPKAVNYNGLTAVLIEVVKELLHENRGLRRRLEALEEAVGTAPVPAAT